MQNKINVLFDGVIYSEQSNGGITTYSNNLLQQFERTKDLYITLLLHEPILGNLKSLKKFKYIYRLSSFSIGIFNKLRASYWNYKFVKTISNTQIFHSTYYTKLQNPEIPQVVTVYDMIYELMPEHFPRNTATLEFIQQKRDAIMNAEAVICISNSTKKDLLAVYGAIPGKIFVVPLGVDHHLYKIPSHDFNKKRKYITFIGSRASYKNFELLIKAFSSWKENNNYTLLVVGQKLNKQEQKLIDKMGIKNFELIIGAREENMPNIYHNSHAVVMPSLYEGFGLPLLEAAASGTLVLASNIPAHQEVGKQIPIYFDPHEVQSLVYALNKSLDHVLSSNQIKKGMLLASRFTWEQTALQTRAIYKSLI